MNPTERRLVFVYGTLKRGGSNHRYMDGQTFCGEARTMPGFSLINLGDYPGIVLDPNDQDGVTGELWSVDEACLEHLDILEGVKEGLYRRARIALVSPSPDHPVITYFYALDPSRRMRVPGGVWIEPTA